MEDQAEVKIITVDAVQNLNDLKKAISENKKALQEQELGSEKYQRILTEITKEQNLLRAAMHGTTADSKQLKDAIDENGKSYNALVNRMADLKRQFRATSDEAQRANLGAEIRDINNELKRLDALKGDFQRNVGDYLAKDLKDVVKDLPSGLKAIHGPLDDVQKSLSLMGKQPILGIVGLLAPMLIKIADALKDDDNAMKAVKKAMDSLKPITDFFVGVMDSLVGILTDVIAQVTEFVTSNGLISKVINGLAGVGNAIVQFVVSPFKGVIAAIKVFKEQGVKGIGDAARAFGAEMKSGVAFKANYDAGAVLADTFMAGARSRKKQARDTGKAIVQEVQKGAEESIDEMIAKAFDRAEKAAAERLRKRQADESFVNELIAENLAEVQAEMDAYFEAERIEQETSVKIAQEAAKKKMEVMSAYADGVSGLMSAVAEALDGNENASEKQVKAAKNLRIAAATIDMISGAVTAYSTAQELGPIAGPIVGAINAAAVIASGLANIAKIKATTVSKDSAPSTSVEAPAATVAAPALESVTPTTVMTGASTETALNNAARSQRVYILQSDIEAAGNTSRTLVAESSF